MEFRDYLRMLRRGWLVVTLFTVVAVGLAGTYVTFVPRTYQSSSLIYVSVLGPRSIGDLQQGVQFSSEAAKTYASLAESPSVLEAVIKDLRLDATTAELSAAIDVNVRSDTSLIQVNVNGSNARQTADIANAVAVETAKSVNRLETTTSLLGVRTFVRLRQVQVAETPLIAVSPNVRRTMALGLIAGLILGLSFTFLAQSLDTRIRGPRTLWGLTRLPLVAAIPRVRRSQAATLLVREDPSSEFGEAFRTLRTNLRFLETGEQRSLVLAAAAPVRSGVNVAANLGWSLAEVGYRVVVVDGNLRHPEVAPLLGTTEGKGLSDVLAGHVRLEEALYETAHPKLTSLPGGTLPPNPSELLGSPELGTIVATLEDQFDYVLVDAPPVLSYNDAAVLAMAAQRTLVTVTSGATRTAQLSAALGRLENAGQSATGVVLTQIRHGFNREEFIRPPEVRPVSGPSAADPQDRPALPTSSGVGR